MGNMLREFWQEEEGMGTVEIVLILAVLVSIALMFRKQVIEFVSESLDNIFTNASENGKVDTGAGAGG